MTTISGWSQQNADDQPISLTKKQWQDDLHALYDSLQANHLNIYHFSSKAEFERKYSSFYEEIPTLNNYQIFLRFKQLVSLAGDGHTMLIEPENYRKYPLDYFIFNNQVILIRSDAAYKTALGLPLLSINNHPIKQIRDSLNTIVDHGESATYVLKQQTDRLNIPEYLMAFGFISDKDAAVFEFGDEKKRIKVNVPIPANKSINWQWAYNPLPLFLKNGLEPKEPITHQSINPTTYYVNFSGYPSWEDFEKTTMSIYDSLNLKKTATKIIIDMRLNSGGNFDKGLKLMLPMFLNYNALHPGVKYYVLIGRQTFSAGMSNAVHFKDCLGAELVGEPTGARPNGYQEIKWFKLPNSLLNASCSLLFYTFQKKNSDGIRPDKQILPSLEAYKRGIDPAIEWILNGK
ncbi:hypothetical protein KTO58_15480 [Chitinophaga pendula]|uniref:hypothetical protein n=1 Tax=Chitinophaga TaxID=79328 RepID=UPI000BAF6050|nr:MULTISPECIES: hypothetical protein [Chitinophaga]ASZ11878.1 hypothetical protein CK934_13370 [Chitinophaga sp. MD30]UCJ05097.1 hypothetical protein KTO58_15480 [Chitinophaga pendula]